MTGSRGVFLLVCVAGMGVSLPAVAQESEDAGGVNCSFRASPDEFLSREIRSRDDIFQRMARLGKSLPRYKAAKPVSAHEVPRNNFIDIAIFDKMAADGVPSAPLSSDEEFLRRASLDLTGRIPSAADVRTFLEDGAADKRRATIDRLLFSPEFVDKWTMWLGDLFQNTQASSNVTRTAAGRNVFYDYMRTAIYENRSLKDIVFEVITGRGNSFAYGDAPVNFIIGGRSPTGPGQDSYDNMLFKSTSTFLGLGSYDCLLCHDGRRHLDQLNLWGKNATRLDAYRMAAFFSRTGAAGNQPFPINRDAGGSYNVTDRTTGTYDLNTNFGNRPNRVAIGSLRNITPEYHFTGAKPSGNDWRRDFAENLVRDPLVAVNFANRLWRAMFNMGLIEPLDGLDPARLDPANPPEAPWSLQATHPELLQELAKALAEGNYNIREYLRMIAESSAYQLSSRFDDTWKVEYVPYFARRYARRLEGEEIHDAIVQSTGVMIKYAIGGWLEGTEWAVKVPEPVEPRSNGEANNFMNTFYRGNRDTLQRSQSGSILQQLFLMNNSFVTNRVRMSSSPRLQALSRLTDNGYAVDELFLTFLGRLPTEYERGVALEHLRPATTAAARNAAIDDLAWACVNKLEFLFSY